MTSGWGIVMAVMIILWVAFTLYVALVHKYGG
jgi:hypothetical protein